jgi:hypothetical protein
VRRICPRRHAGGPQRGRSGGGAEAVEEVPTALAGRGEQRGQDGRDFSFNPIDGGADELPGVFGGCLQVVKGAAE